MRARFERMMVLALFVFSLGALVPPVAHADSRRRAAAAPASARSLSEASAGVLDILGGAPGKSALRECYGANDAVVLFDSLVSSMDEEGRISRRRHRAVMLFTDNAINRHGDPRILFNAATQELAVMAARVYMRDGTIVDTQKNGINQTTPFSLEKAPDLTDWQETVVTHVGVEKGCVAELHYVIRDKAPSPWLSGVEVVSAEDPTLERTVEVRVPAGVALRDTSWNGVPQPASPAPGTFVWTMRDLPGRTPFDGGAWEGDYFPTIVYSTAASWTDVCRTLQSSAAGEVSTVSETLKDAARKAAKENQDARQQILEIHRAEIGCVSSIKPPFGFLAEAPRSANRIYESAYATPLERAVLLREMLDAAGHQSSIVLVARGKASPGSIPAPEIFGSALVVAGVTQPGPALWLDPSIPYDHGSPPYEKTFLNVDQCAVTTFGYRVMHDRPSGTSLDITLKAGENGALAGDGIARMTGLFSPYYMLRGTGSETKDYITSRCRKMFGGAEVTSWNLLALDPARVEIAFHFTVTLPEKKPGERVYLSLPKPFEAAESGIERVHVERSYCPDAIKVEPSRLSVRCTFEEPNGWRLVILPRTGGEENPVGKAQVTAVSRPGEPTALGKSLAVDSDLVRPESYGELRALLLRFADDGFVLERK